MTNPVSGRFPFAVLFDMDGVIVDSNPYHKVALRDFCVQHGYDLTEEDLRTKIYGRTNRGWITALFGDIPEETLRTYADEKEALYRKLFEQDIKPVTGLVDFLNSLDQHSIARGIGTSAPRENVDFTLGRTGLSKYFEVILDESFVSRGKPDPEIYLKTAAALGYPATACFVVEDSMAGVESGLASGALVVAITTTHTREEFSHAHLVIDDFTQLSPEVLHRTFEAHGRNR
ncbi:MAG: HAD family hydrolase [Bacteroidota bacterium]